MATWDDVDRIAAVLPDTAADGRAWRVHGKLFVWERALRARDRAELGDTAPAEAPAAFRVADEGEKEALVGDDPQTFFTTSHFDGYPIVLARLDRVPVPELEEIVQDAWLARAPRRIAAQYLDRSE
ncbi:MmcQ/YjbR family DNA-binding protein [Cellulosimicrobium arenosum]|uniref:MmcQ/YjbR family DNA-binding protein n=1 Tax=Cellulosimicrobium arenosum TaxID=2708133 RepID=A0A927PGI5_9MICO|nr:MmcQ/YjbR family DNA-binding protein [Cellulosimicrobium arenosum]MBD8080419.1 MmcQ/YjbR family DNA-binding protein [Cellulosimicrobium arenosum]